MQSQANDFAKTRDSPRSYSPETTQYIEQKLAELNRNGISVSQLKSYLQQRAIPPTLPIQIFATELAPLQALVKYLRQNCLYSNIMIARLLGRSNKTIWQTYAIAQNLHSELFAYGSSNYDIPLSVFQPTSLTVFEQLVTYLRKRNLTYHKIAQLLHRDERTIWTVCKRAERKRDAQ